MTILTVAASAGTKTKNIMNEINDSLIESYRKLIATYERRVEILDKHNADLRVELEILKNKL